LKLHNIWKRLAEFKIVFEGQANFATRARNRGPPWLLQRVIASQEGNMALACSIFVFGLEALPGVFQYISSFKVHNACHLAAADRYLFI
jgi:hypothetical protein